MTKKEKLLKAIQEGKVKDETTLAVFAMISDLEDKIDEELPNIKNIIERMKGEDGHTPTDKELIDLIKPLIPEPIKGEDGKTPTNAELLKLIKPLIPKIENGKPPTKKELLDIIKPLLPVINASEIALEASNRAYSELLPKIPTIDQIAELLPQRGKSVRDSLETLIGDDRLSSTAIKGLDKFSTQENFDNAIGILDQRTQFLINKTINWGKIQGTITNQTDLIDYISSQISVENLFDRTLTTISPHTSGDSLDMGAGNITTTELITGGSGRFDGGLGVGTNSITSAGLRMLKQISTTGGYGYGTYSTLSTSGAFNNQFLYGEYATFEPNGNGITIYGNKKLLVGDIFNDPTVDVIGYYVAWDQVGTDANNKKWAFYNASTSTIAGKIFLGLDNVKTYWGTGYDEYIEYDPTFDGLQTAGKMKMTGLSLNAVEVWVKAGDTIQATIDAITDAAVDKPYIVNIPPGDYTEQIVSKAYVSLRGAGKNSTIIRHNEDHTIITANQVSISDMSVIATGDSGVPILNNIASAVIYLDNLYLEGSWDLVIMNGNSAVCYAHDIEAKAYYDGFVGITGTNQKWYLYNVNVEIAVSSYTSFGIFRNEGGAGSVMNVYNPSVYGSITYNTGTHKIFKNIQTMNVYGPRCELSFNLSTATTYGVSSESGAITNVYGGSVILTNAGAGTKYDLFNAGTLNVYGVKYSTSSGTITGFGVDDGLLKSYDGGFTTTGLITAGSELISKANDGGDTNLIIRNTAGSGSTDETASLIFQSADGQNAGKIVSGRLDDYSGTAEYASFLDFYTTNAGTDELALRIDNSGNFDFQDGNLTTTGTLEAGAITGLTNLTIDNININGAAITSDTGAISFNDDNLTTTGGFEVATDLTAQAAFGTASPSATYKLHVYDNMITDFSRLALFEAETTGTSTISSALTFKLTTSGDMTDGFGPGFLYAIQDVTGAENFIARTAAVRNGADNTGQFEVTVWDAGTARIELKVNQDSLEVGAGKAGVDYRIRFNGENSDGLFIWREDEDYFEFWDDVVINTGENLIVEGGDITSDYIKTGGNEFLAHDAIRHTVDATDVSNGYISVSWNKATMAKIVHIGSTVSDGTYAYAPYNIVYAGTYPLFTYYNGSTIRADLSSGGPLVAGDVITIYVVYEK